MTLDHRFIAETVSVVHATGADLARTAEILRVAASAPGPVLTRGWLAARKFDAEGDGGVLRAIKALERVGLMRPTEDALGWMSQASASRLAELSVALLGASAAWGEARKFFAPEIAVTFPGNPSAIAAALDRVLIDYTRLVSTDAALDRVADRAVEEFTVLTPFLNRAAAPALARVFLKTRAPNRTLVIRNFRKVGRALLAIRDELEAANVQILDYRNQDPNDTAAYETFHAKVALADNDHAYVGSANFLRYTRSTVELGVILNGGTVRIVGGLVRAIRSIARPCDLRTLTAA